MFRALLPLLLALLVVVGVLAAFAAQGGVPFFALRAADLGLPIEPFGAIVVLGVVIGAFALRRYGARHGIALDDARTLTLWVVLSGAIGAHVIEVLMYERGRLTSDPLILLKLWQGISSFGGFLGGAIGWVAFVWRRRMPWGVSADATMIGLLVAFTIGRVACTLVHDHIGVATGSWLGTDYPRGELVQRGVADAFPGVDLVVRAHNLGLEELLFLLPLNGLVLGLAFQDRFRFPAGLISALIGLAYVPVRFWLDTFRLDVSDPRHAGLTFAQWASFATFAAALATVLAIWRGARGGGSQRT